MSQIGDVIMNVLIQHQALDAAVTGNITAIIIAIDYLCLLCASIIGLAVVIERAVRLRPRRLVDPEILESVPQRMATGDTEGAILLCDKSKSIMGEVFSKELKEHQSGHVPIEEAMDAANDMADEYLSTNLDILGTVAKIAPLLGLLGTVLGMMYAFGQLDIGMRKETLAQGITAALDTTVRGLIIAIVCLSFERYFHRHINKMMGELNMTFTRIVRATRRKQKENGD